MSKKIDFNRLTLKFSQIPKTHKLAYISVNLQDIKMRFERLTALLGALIGTQLAFVGDLSLKVKSLPKFETRV